VASRSTRTSTAQTVRTQLMTFAALNSKVRGFSFTLTNYFEMKMSLGNDLQITILQTLAHKNVYFLDIFIKPNL
jgi:hypothetical protein